VDIDELRRNWDEFGRRDPLWAILSEPGTQGGRWDLDAFLAAGEAEIDDAFERLDALGIEVKLGTALDFGCGVGRLTQALGRRFDRVHGVDIASTMIDEGRRINRLGARCEYHVNHAPDLGLFADATFDFVYTTLVLQHMEPRYIESYIGEFGRVLAPGGVAMFQVPSAPADERVEPLPTDAYAARVVPRVDRLTVEPGATLRLDVDVTNMSTVPWPENSSLRVGNHWRSRHRRMLVHDDGREPLLRALEPGETIGLTLIAVAPVRAGHYVLELDVVQERVAWFADRGSPVAHVPVRVTRSPVLRRRRREPEGTTGLLRPVMEIHGIPPERVADRCADAGLTLLDTSPSRRVQGWQDHQYVAGKAG
jgi:SAM-dependent methyltransferase